MATVPVDVGTLTTNELFDELEKRMTAFVIVHESTPRGPKKLDSTVIMDFNFINCSHAHALGLLRWAQLMIENSTTCEP